MTSSEYFRKRLSALPAILGSGFMNKLGVVTELLGRGFFAEGEILSFMGENLPHQKPWSFKRSNVKQI